MTSNTLLNGLDRASAHEERDPTDDQGGQGGPATNKWCCGKFCGDRFKMSPSFLPRCMFSGDRPLAINNGRNASSMSKWSTRLKVATFLSNSCKAMCAVPMPPHNSRTLSPFGKPVRSRLRHFHVASVLQCTDMSSEEGRRRACACRRALVGR